MFQLSRLYEISYINRKDYESKSDNKLKPSFTSKLKFCTLDEYMAKKPKEYDDFSYESEMQRYGYPYGNNSIQYADNIVSGGICTCSAGGITDLNNSVRYHFSPIPENLDDLADNASKLKENLKEKISSLKQGKCFGFLLGGVASVAKEKETPEIKRDYIGTSRRLFENLKRFFNHDLKVDISYFWGQNNRNQSKGTETYYTKADDTWRILKFTEKDSDKTVSSVEDLFENFEQVHVADGDEVIIGERAIPKSELELEAMKRRNHNEPEKANS